MIRSIHPANNVSFLALAANDFSAAGVNNNPPTFGLHLGTALLACQIVAFNAPGFLSTSRDRSVPHIPNTPRDILLLDRKYYFHLVDDILHYPICLNFSEWRFPHEMVRANTIWAGGAQVRGITERPPPSGVSGAIKARDGMCLVSLWHDGVKTSHLAPRTEEQWLLDNHMDVHADMDDYSLNEDQYNLFTLRADLHLIFNQGAFVFVPKSGQLRVHFLKRVRQSGILYHDTLFNHHDRLSRGFLLARFGWAVIRLAKEQVRTSRAFDFSAEDDDENDGGGSREPIRKKSKPSHTKKTPTGRSSRIKKGSRTHLEPEVIQDPSQRDAAELARDLDVATRAAPFFVNETELPSTWHYEHMKWYPGAAAVRRRKQAYIENNPQIRATSGQAAVEGTSSDRGFDSD